MVIRGVLVWYDQDALVLTLRQLIKGQVLIAARLAKLTSFLEFAVSHCQGLVGVTILLALVELLSPIAAELGCDYSPVRIIRQ